MTGPGPPATWGFLLRASLAAARVLRAHYTAGVSTFLPRSASATQRLLVEQLRAGPAARLILIGLEGGDTSTRAQLSRELARRLKADRAFATVGNGASGGLTRGGEFLSEHGYLPSAAITPQRFPAPGLHAALADALDELALPEGALVKGLFARDPTLETLAILESLAPARMPPTREGVWSSPDGSRALLIVQTRAPGSDTDAQQAACRVIRAAFAAGLMTLPAAARASSRLLLAGPPVFAVNARALIKSEVMRLSGLSALAVAALLLFVYRSASALLLTLVPVASGALAGIAAVALGFDGVHGLTLGFGVTLIGEAVDYSIYLFIQRGADFRQAVWPTIRLGMLTSICGFAALLPSAFPGLAQLGLYSVTGLVAAALGTRFVLPGWLPHGFAIPDLRPAGVRLARVLPPLRRWRALLGLVPLLAGAVLYLPRGALFSRELSSLSPIPPAAQALDEQLRAALGAPDVGYLIVVSAPNRESALSAAQQLAPRLGVLADEGVIGGFDSPARYLPPGSVQRSRQAGLPAPGERAARPGGAAAGLPGGPVRLQPFLLGVGRGRPAAPLPREDREGTSSAAGGDAPPISSSGGFAALLPLSAP